MKKIQIPIATIIFSFVLVLFYFLISGGRTYITPLSIMYPLGVSSGNLIGSFTYTFTHIGVKHLLGNLVALFVFGTIIEQIIDRWHAAGVFLVSGIFGGAVYALIHPDIWVIGASTSIAGLLAVGSVLDPKKTAISFVLVMFLVPNVILPGTDVALDALEDYRLKQAAAAEGKLGDLDKQIKLGNFTKETIEQKGMEQQKRDLAIKSKESLEEGRGTEAATPASLEIHLLGAFFALAFLWSFDRDLLKKQWRRLLAIIKS